jgi:hypothetical protein
LRMKRVRRSQKEERGGDSEKMGDFHCVPP